MHKTLNYFASEQCPVGCGEVLYLKAKVSGKIFCHCTGCGCNWANPKECQFKTGLNQINSILEYASSGVELPTKEEISDAGFSDFIFGFSEGAGTYSAQEINEYAYKNA